MSQTAVPPNTTDQLGKSVLLVAGVVVLGAIMSILDITIVTVAQPAFQNDFGATPAQSAWSMTGYTLALASVIPLTGWAADRFGTKRLYLLAIVLFAIGSVLCALAWDVTSLVTFRLLQGLGGGILAPLGMTILTRAAEVALVALLGALVFNETLSVPAMIGIAVIIAGVLIVETGAPSSTTPDGPATHEEAA